MSEGTEEVLSLGGLIFEGGLQEMQNQGGEIFVVVVAVSKELLVDSVSLKSNDLLVPFLQPSWSQFYLGLGLLN